MGLGFSPLPYRLQLNRRDLSTVQPESTTVALVSFFFYRVREPQVGKQQQAAATERPTALGAVAMELSASFRVNVRVLVGTNLNLQKAIVAGVQQYLPECKLRFRNSQDLRIRRTCAHICQTKHVFSARCKWPPHCFLQIAMSARSYHGQNPEGLRSKRKGPAS
jgi:hypothetical protein